jgi:O-antigen ligase
MKNMLLNVTYRGKVFFILIALLAVSIPLYIRINSILLIVTFCSVGLMFLYTKERTKGAEFLYLLLIALYFLHFIGLVNSDNLKVALFDLEQKVPLLVMPLIFMLSPAIEKRHFHLTLLSFVGITTVLCLLSFRNGFYFGFKNVQWYDSLLVHRPYLGMYCVFSIFICIDLLKDILSPKYRYVLFLLIIFNAVYLVILFAKMAIISLVVLAITYSFLHNIFNKNYRLAISISGFCFLCILYLGLFNEKGNTIVKKVMTFDTFDWDNYIPVVVNSMNLRFTNWSCSAEVLSENKNWLYGAGTGDTQQLLLNCYAEKAGNDSVFYIERYNSHNNFLTVWLHLGLFPLIFFIVHFLYFIYFYFINKNLLGIIFTFGIMLFCLTESVFEVQKGIIFYAFFQSLLICAHASSIKTKITLTH